MIGLYYKEGVKWLDLEEEEEKDYLVTRFGMLRYQGEIPIEVKDRYLTHLGVGLVRNFMQRLRGGDFYLKVERWNEGHACYNYYLGLNSLDNTHPFLTTCGTNKLRYFDAYWFKHIVENAVRHYIAEGEVIAGVLLWGGGIKIKGAVRTYDYHAKLRVMIDISSTYLPIAFDDVRRLMKGRNRITSVTWANMKIIMVNDLPIEEI
jgi:hypothetical protein